MRLTSSVMNMSEGSLPSSPFTRNRGSVTGANTEAGAHHATTDGDGTGSPSAVHSRKTSSKTFRDSSFFSFAPVLDLQSSFSTVIGDRAFHANPDAVALLAAEYVANMKMCGMSSVGKHFPGHGLVVEDSHFEIPVDKRKISEILSRDIVPYDKLIKAGLSGVMMAHILYTSIDNKVAGYSQFWIQEVLRKKQSNQCRLNDRPKTL